MASPKKQERHALGRMVVFEGPDGVGKSSIAKAVAERLVQGGQPVDLLSFPGREPSTLGELVYRLHHSPNAIGLTSVVPAAIQALHVAAHIDVIRSRISVAVQSGRVVVLDRFWWSTWVYGRSAGVSQLTLNGLIDAERAEWGSLMPSVVYLLRRAQPITREIDLRVWRKLCREYKSLAERESPHYQVSTVNNSLPFEATVLAIEADLRRRGLLQAASTPTAQAQRQPNSSHDSRKQHRVSEGPVSRPGHSIHSHLSPAKPSALYDAYWRFAAERQAIFFRRIAKTPPPWTNDPILRTYKFTNAYRASDRVSQYLIRNVIYRDDLPKSETEVCFRILLFKLFNKIETWELLERSLGPLTYSEYAFAQFDRVLGQALRSRQRIYSAAYIMPPGGLAFGHPAKHQNHLRLLERMMSDDLPMRLADAKSMQRAFELLRGYPTVGDFLAYQFVTDINYSNVTNFSEMEFVMPGPGALDGLRKCFVDPGGLNEPELIRYVADIQQKEFARLGITFQDLWGRSLQLIDCQNLFCEIDKYGRVAYPEIAGLSGRTRIKQKYVQHLDPISCWYPPKWNLDLRGTQPLSTAELSGTAHEERFAQQDMSW